MAAIRVCSSVVDWVSADTPIKTTINQQQKMRGTSWLSVLLPPFRFKKEKNDEFEAVFMELAAQVLANEPGCKFYALNRSKSDPQVYKVLESYEDQAALEAHGQTDYFKAANVKLAGLVGGRPDIEYLDGVE